MLEILSRCGGPVGIRKASRRKLAAIATKHAPRMGTTLVEEITAALGEQTVTVPGTADAVLPQLAASQRFWRNANRSPPRLRGYSMRTLSPGS